MFLEALPVNPFSFLPIKTQTAVEYTDSWACEEAAHITRVVGEDIPDATEVS